MLSFDTWDHHLIAAREGNRDALGKLLQEYWQQLWQHAHREMEPALISKHSPSDLVQESFMEAQLAFNNFSGTTREELYSWLRSILINNIKDLWRAYYKVERRAIVREQPLESVASNLKDSHWQVDPAIKLAVEDAIAKLPPDYQQVIRLRYWDRYGFQEIGFRMDRSAEAARHLWRRAVRAYSTLVSQEMSRRGNT